MILLKVNSTLIEFSNLTLKESQSTAIVIYHDVVNTVLKLLDLFIVCVL